MVPFGRVEGGSGEVVFAGKRRRFGDVQSANAGNEKVADERLAGSGSDSPQAPVFAPTAFIDANVEPDFRPQLIMIRDFVQISEDFRLRRETCRPKGIREEREGIQVGHNVAGAARVSVVVPSTAQTRRFFQN